MRIVVSCSGKFHAFALVEQLERSDYDVVFFTSYSSIVNPFLKFFVKRRDKEVINPQTIKTNFFIALLLKVLPSNPQFANDLFDYWVSRKIRNMEADFLIGWSGMSLLSLKVAKSKDWKTILERGSTHISFQNGILKEEYLLRGIEYSITQSTIIKETREYEMCDIISIPSNFVKRSFIDFGINEDKLFVNPYGSNGYFNRTASKKDSVLRVLYLGRISIQKGFYYLAGAIENLQNRDIEFWLIGAVDDDVRAILNRLITLPNVNYFGHIDHYELVNYIQQCDIGIQPSLQEGLSMVIPQMMKVGLPVVATPNSGAEELIIDNYNGIIIPARSSAAIVDVLLNLLLDRQVLKSLAKNVIDINMESNSWVGYGNRYKKILMK